MRRDRGQGTVSNPTPPAATATDLSVTEPTGGGGGRARPRVHERVTPKHWEERQRHRDEQATAIANVFEQMLARLGGILALDQAAAAGDVLGALSVIIPSNGFISRGWKQPAAAVAIANYSPGDVTITMSASPAGSTPTQGTGVFRIPSGSVRVLNA